MRSWMAMRHGGVGAEDRKRVVEMRRLRSQPKPLFLKNPHAVLSPESTLENKEGGRTCVSSGIALASTPLSVWATRAVLD